jgi:phage FluMu protein Com
MTITFKCEHCGKKVEAPDSLGGKRGKCPYCKQSNYIPSPVTDDDLIPLAPEDAEAEQQSHGERSQERVLIAAMDTVASMSVPLEHRDEVSAEDLYHLVVNYCLGLSGSKLEEAQDNLARLQRFPHSAATAVEDFISGKAIEPALDGIPAKILQGFLNQLRDALKSGI